MGVSGAALFLAACGSSASSSSSSSAAGSGTSGASAASGSTTVTWTNVALPSNLDPAIGFDSDTLQVVRNVYEGLLEYAPGSTELRPALAESYSRAADGLTYTFKLRKGVVFHDGSKLDAAAVVASLKRIQAIAQGPASLLIDVKGFEAKGDSTVLVHMTKPYVFLPGVMPWLPIVSPAALKAHATSKDPHAEKWFAQNAAGTGPYTLESFSQSKIGLGQNKHYWQKWQSGTPMSGSLTLNANVTTQLELLQNGQVDFLGAISPDNAVSAKSLSNVALITQPGLEVQTIPLNMMRAPMNNLKVRQAMVKAFDYNAFTKFNKGFGKPANSPVPQGLTGWDASLPTPKQDLAGAKKLLAEAGVASGTELEMVTVGGLDYETFAGTIMQSALQQLGLKISVKSSAWPEPATLMSKGASGGAHRLSEPVEQHRRPKRDRSPGVRLVADRQQGRLQLVLLPRPEHRRRPGQVRDHDQRVGAQADHHRRPAADRRAEPVDPGLLARDHRAGGQEVEERQVRRALRRERRPLVLRHAGLVTTVRPCEPRC